ncbi:MAG: glutamate-5-semialdehyde dehydrogenase [Microcoleaceae cyanobacterium]
MAVENYTPSPHHIEATVDSACEASIVLSQIPGSERNQALKAMAMALEQHQNDILEANTLDLEANRETGIPEILGEWLKLTPKRLETTIQILQRLGELPDPIGRVVSASYQLEQCQTYYQSIPLGVVALIYEAFPELGAIAAGLCLKTANSLLLVGGTEAYHSNQIITQILQSKLEEMGMPLGGLEMISPQEDAALQPLVIQNPYINLAIPYGRPHLINQVVRQATVPVLRSALGNCYLYWSATAGVDLVRWMILESHNSQPDAVNAIEKVLIDPNQKLTFLTRLWNSLREAGFVLKGDPQMVEAFPELELASDAEWDQPYLNKTITFRFVEDIQQAITIMNQFSSGHANCLATESYTESRQFALNVNSAMTYINASPQFSRHQNRGDSIFLGMSNQKGYRRGLIGLEALTTVQHIVQGNGRFS